jgi:acyl-CoA thioesterase
VEVVTRVVRDGRRIKVIDAEFVSGGVPMARATCQLLRRTENPAGHVWTPPPWDAPAPADIVPLEASRQPLGGMWTILPISGAMGTAGQRRLWMTERRELVEGDPWTPFARVAVSCDFASPFANAGDQGLAYINSDVTLYLHRLPVSEWVGYEVVNHGATDGVAIGECFVHDEQGPIGSATVAALAQARGMK